MFILGVQKCSALPSRAGLCGSMLSLLAAALGLAACGSDAGKQQVSEASAGTGALSARGSVSRKIPLSMRGDGLGVVHISVDKDCRNDQGTTTKPLGALEIDDVDLRDDDASVPFVITGLEAGKTYYAAAWFDDVDNPEQDEVLPATGDLAMFGDLSPRCVELKLNKNDLDGVKLELDYEMMFTLPGTHGDSGVIMTSDASVDIGDIVDDGSRHRVTIHLSRTVEPDMGGDGKGKFFSGLSESCFSDTTGEVPVPIVSLILDEVALPKLKTAIDLVLEDVPNGVYQFNGFIDDAGNADAKSPRPGIGDLVSFGGTGPACAQVVVNGKDAEADFKLNFVMPFDL